jgi:tetratricopeptide (TPR) repeat protein
MMRAHAFAIALSSLSIAAVPARTWAGPVSDPQAAAQDELEAGLAAYQRGDYDTAIGHFRRAYELHESPQYLYAWAQAARSAGDCASAIDLYRRFIESGATGDSRVAAEQNEARCREQLETTPAPQVPTAEPPPSTETETETAPTPEPDPTRRDEAPASSRARPDALGLGLLVGGSVAVAAGGTVLAISGVRRVRQSDTSQYDRFDALDREIDRLDIAGSVTLGIGAALVLGGAIRLALVQRQRRALARTTLVSPALGPGGSPMLVLTIRPTR